MGNDAVSYERRKLMYTNEHRRAVGIFSNRDDAQSALYELRDAGFPMDRISVIAQNLDQGEQIGGVEAKSREEQAKGGAGAGAVAGTATGGLLGLIGSIGVLAIPGVGIAAEAGIVLANTLLGSGLGAAGGGLLGALIGWGIPEDQARYYDERVTQGDYLVMVEGTLQEIQTAEAVLNRRGIRDWNTYRLPGTATSRDPQVGSRSRY